MTSSVRVDPSPPSRARPPRRPAAVPEADLSSYVLAALDEHLAVLHAIRDQLTTARPIHPGARRAAAAHSVAAARDYADEVARALNL